MKKFYRVEEGKMIAGVCGGIAEHFAIDPTVVRILWVIISLSCAVCGLFVGVYGGILLRIIGSIVLRILWAFFGLLIVVGGIIAYIIAAVIMPKKSDINRQ